MKTIVALCILCIAISSCSHTYYVVRHAEKANSTSNTPLSAAGHNRARALRDTLLPKKIKVIYSTGFLRTDSTARPLSQATGINITRYRTDADSLPGFISKLRKGRVNMLIVGHSNTIDNIANGLAGEQKVSGDINDAVYDNMFIIRVSTFLSKKVTFKAVKYGAPTP